MYTKVIIILLLLSVVGCRKAVFISFKSINKLNNNVVACIVVVRDATVETSLKFPMPLETAHDETKFTFYGVKTCSRKHQIH